MQAGKKQGSSTPPIDPTVKPYQTMAAFQAQPAASAVVAGGKALAALPQDLSATAMGDLLTTLRKCIDDKDELDGQVKDFNAAIDRLESEVKARMLASKLEKVSGAGLTVSLSEKQNVKYDPLQWDSIVLDLVTRGKIYMLQRRLSDAKIREEYAAGSFSLPKGLTLEPYRDLSVRRTK